MPDGRGLRLALEAVFLVAVAVVLVVARFGAAWIVLVMLVAWLIVAALEWVAWREEPHWSSGLPPRYHVPEQPLPPRPPSVELPAFTTYPRPAPREVETPTWIATPQMRAEVLGWPAAGLDGEAPASEEPQTTVEELPEELLAEVAAGADELDVGWPVAREPVEDPWFEPEPEPEFEPDPEPAPAAVEPEPEPAPAAVEPEPEAEAEPAHDPEPEPVAAAPAPRPQPGSAPRAARHRLDPYAGQPARRWRRGRAGEAEVGVVELGELPRHVRLDTRARAGRDA